MPPERPSGPGPSLFTEELTLRAAEAGWGPCLHGVTLTCPQPVCPLPARGAGMEQWGQECPRWLTLHDLWKSLLDSYCFFSQQNLETSAVRLLSRAALVGQGQGPATRPPEPSSWCLRPPCGAA